MGKPGGMVRVGGTEKNSWCYRGFFFFLKVSKYFTFPLPLNHVSWKWSVKGAASTGCVALGPEVCASLPRRQSLKAEVPEASFSSSSFKPHVSCKKPNKGEKRIQGFIVVGKEHMRLKKGRFKRLFHLSVSKRNCWSGWVFLRWR